MSATLRSVLPALVLVLGAPLVAAAQNAPAAEASVVDTVAAPRGPVAMRPLLAQRPVAAPSTASHANAQASTFGLPRLTQRKSVGFMAGGVAAVVAGALIKGTTGGVLAVGGALATFYGLAQYIDHDDFGAKPKP